MAQRAASARTKLTVAPSPKSKVKAEYRHPVYDLNSSLDVARIIRERGGGAATGEQLAGFLGYAGTNNGAYLTRLASARYFGLVEREDSSYVATPLALRILLPEHPGVDDRRARIEAFERVPLYRVLRDRYRGVALPPEVGLRNALEHQYGIPNAKTQIVYRVFMDSAEQAGYFDARAGARTHLVQPQIGVAIPHPADGSALDQEEIEEIQSERTSPPPQQRPLASGGIFERLQEALVEKLRDVPADDLEKVREYIKEIRELEELKPKEPVPSG